MQSDNIGNCVSLLWILQDEFVNKLTQNSVFDIVL